jgi:hypothetical protein
LLRDVWRGFVSAVLPDVTEIKDVRALRAIIAASPAGAASGSSSITKTLDRLTVLRGPGESYSDVILRPAKASS